MPPKAKDTAEFDGIRVDAERWPILEVTLPPVFSADAVEGCLEYCAEVRYRKPGPFVLAFHLPDSISPAHRGLIEADPGEEVDGKRSLCLGVALILPSWVDRLRARLGLGVAGVPLRVVGDPSAARRWGRRRLRVSGVPSGPVNAGEDSFVGGSGADLDEPPTIEAVAVPVPDADGSHWVQVGVFASERRAHLRADTMLDQGLVALVMEERKAARSRYLVRFGPYGTDARAKVALRAVEDLVPDASIVADERD